MNIGGKPYVVFEAILIVSAWPSLFYFILSQTSFRLVVEAASCEDTHSMPYPYMFLVYALPYILCHAAFHHKPLATKFICRSPLPLELDTNPVFSFPCSEYCRFFFSLVLPNREHWPMPSRSFTGHCAVLHPANRSVGILITFVGYINRDIQWSPIGSSVPKMIKDKEKCNRHCPR